jgi:hypothetical protein
LAVRAKAFKRELRICRARVHAHSLALFFHCWHRASVRIPLPI